MPTNDNTDETTDEVTDNQPDIKALRDAADRSAANKADADAARKELAFVKAGVDTDKPLAKVLLGQYSGELTKDSVQEFLKGLGAETLLSSTPAPAATTDANTDPVATDEERAAAQARKTLAAGNSNPDDGSKSQVHPWEGGLSDFHDAMARGVDRKDAAVHAFNKVFAAAAEGDARVLVLPEAA